MPPGEDLKTISIHILNAGHFALETRAAEIADYIREFLAAHDVSSKVRV